MAQSVFELFAKIGIDSSGFTQGLSAAQNTFNKVGTGLKNGISVIAKGTTVAVGAISTAITASSAALVKSTQEVAAYGDTIDKQSQKIGISAEAYQEWDAILQHSGTDASILTTSMKSLVNAVTTNSDAFQQLGISQEEALGMGQEKLFSTVITKLQQMDDETERTYIATKILGKGAMEMGSLLNTSAEDTEKMRQELHNLNAVMSDESVKASATYQDTLQDMQTAFSGIKNSIIGEFIAPVTEVMQGITDVMKGSDEGIDKVVNGITKISDTAGSIVYRLSEKANNILPKLLKNVPEAITKIVSYISDTIKSGIPIISETVSSIVVSVSNVIPEVLSSILPELPKVLDSILKTIPDLINGSGNTDLIDSVISFAVGIADTIAANAAPIAQALAKSIPAIINGLVERLPDIIVAVGTVFDAIADAVFNDDGVIDAFVGMIASVIDGAVDNIDDILLAVQALFETVIDKLFQDKNIEKITKSVGKIFGKIIVGAAKIAGSSLGFLITFFERISDTLVESLKNGELPKKLADAFKNLGKGILEAFGLNMEFWDEYWEDFGGKVFDFIEDIESKMGQMVIDAASWGYDLVENFISGLSSNKIYEKIKGIAQSIKDFIGFSEPKKGPLSDFHTFAPDMVDLFVDGIEQNAKKVEDALLDTFSVPKYDINQRSRLGESAAINGRGSVIVNYTQNVTSSQELSEYELWRQNERAIDMIKMELGAV